jgi:hypothetical protein
MLGAPYGTLSPNLALFLGNQLILQSSKSTKIPKQQKTTRNREKLGKILLKNFLVVFCYHLTKTKADTISCAFSLLPRLSRSEREVFASFALSKIP